MPGPTTQHGGQAACIKVLQTFVKPAQGIKPSRLEPQNAFKRIFGGLACATRGRANSLLVALPMLARSCLKGKREGREKEREGKGEARLSSYLLSVLRMPRGLTPLVNPQVFVECPADAIEAHPLG